MPIEIGQVAPSFTLPAANMEGDLSLADFRGKRPVMLALFRGLYCPFCRHHIASLGRVAEKLREAGVEMLGVVATPASRARLYFRFRQAPIRLAADPELTTHRAYGIPGVPMSQEILEAVDQAALALARENGIPAKPGTARTDLDAIDGYQPTAEDMKDNERHQAQFVGQFLVGTDGVVRWANIERTPGEFPPEAEILAACR
jgi:peroxiredoxin